MDLMLLLYSMERLVNQLKLIKFLFQVNIATSWIHLLCHKNTTFIDNPDDDSLKNMFFSKIDLLLQPI